MKGSRAEKNFQFMRSLTEVEPAALSMIKPIDLQTLEPEVIRIANDQGRKLFDYWRYTISSEAQNPTVNMGRTNQYLVRDKTSGGLLGLFILTDTPINNPFFNERWNWNIDDAGDKSTHSINNLAKLRGLHTIVSIRRCLPLYEFGRMTGGKCFTMLAASREIMRVLEQQYSFKLSVLYTRAVHGKSSQYNSLHQWGLNYAGTDHKGAGYYFMNIRKGGHEFLKGERDLGKFAVKSYADNLEQWRTRWLEPRMKSQGVTVLNPNKDHYRLSELMVSRAEVARYGAKSSHEEEGGSK